MVRLRFCTGLPHILRFKIISAMLISLKNLPRMDGNWCRGVVGELDEELDSNLDLSALRAHPLKAVQH